MQTAEAFDKERLEVDALLASGIFNRAPNLARLLKYICEQYFIGAADELKEYNIAVEALGRRPDFDQKRDSIVRVEAYRLRKRLREYYETDGANREIHIDIPSGQYTPRFVVMAPGPDPDTLPSGSLALDGVAPEAFGDVLAIDNPPADSGIVPHPLLSPPNETPPPRRKRHWIPVLAAVAIAIICAFVIPGTRSRADRIDSASRLPLAGPGDEVRILCGVENGTYTDAFERS